MKIFSCPENIMHHLTKAASILLNPLKSLSHLPEYVISSFGPGKDNYRESVPITEKVTLSRTVHSKESGKDLRIQF